MRRRRLSPDEQALWSALTQSVRPLRPDARLPDAPTVALLPPASKSPAAAPLRPMPPPARTPAAVLDSAWERRIKGGTLSPEMSIDLHGHSLGAAHVRLNQALAAALARDVRVLLVVTGKPPRSSATGQDSRRGAIRGEIGHWLESSPHADRIASVRLAHPRHGGEGALYVILRRKR